MTSQPRGSGWPAVADEKVTIADASCASAGTIGAKSIVSATKNERTNDFISKECLAWPVGASHCDGAVRRHAGRLRSVARKGIAPWFRRTDYRRQHHRRLRCGREGGMARSARATHELAC